MQSEPGRRLHLGWLALAVLVSVLLPTPSCAAEGASAPIRIRILPQQHDAGRVPVIALSQRAPQLAVELTNVGDRPIRIWKESCSWGYRNLSFELTDARGAKFAVVRAERGWEKNFPAWETLRPGSSLSLQVLLDSAEWRGLPELAEGQRETFAVRALYESAPSHQADVNQIWVGKVVSAEERCVLSK